ncbi:low molecular weight phosphotyrosine protein phosphatase [Gleimia sp. 6138-11-ORH1]|uniref:low molecular weight protein-tyrosine-phosphatase n=1 Tax=Gleimia sp. 6138-11-ORH1 TaxID=2973937 RepID=UPI00216A98FE|nr:low molecular weight protein-tyrosine-phosphatase [Gleimia sp. 6138-11-ORH1]MCS4484815.1 low molecular weight phosphotyrosine protein phosphatase [Gleimia sp. 6138-11-ORH1]
MTYRVMMVCTGNICRSVMAQIVLNEHLQKAGLEVEVVSSGISAEEQGNPIDYRAQRTLKNAGYVLPEHSAKQLSGEDLLSCDLILAMTYRHFQAVEGLANRFRVPLVDEGGFSRLVMFRAFDPQGGLGAPSGNEVVVSERVLDVPDPWYGDQADFEETLATIERSVPALLAEIKVRLEQQ